jgi:hypothetical protein
MNCNQRRKQMKNLPYASAISKKARYDISKMLQPFGCESVGIMDDYAKGDAVVAFRHRGVAIQIHARTQSGTSMAEGNPLDLSHHTPRVDYEQNALKQGHTAVNSMLRDWVKAQVSIIECGILSFRGCIHALHADKRRPFIDRAVRRNRSATKA